MQNCSYHLHPWGLQALQLTMQLVLTDYPIFYYSFSSNSLWNKKTEFDQNE